MKKIMNAGADASAASAASATGTPPAETQAVTPTPPASSTTPTPPIEIERPSRGGSYVLQKDGSLERVEATEEPGLIERLAAEGEATNG